MTEAHLVAASLAAGGLPPVLKDRDTFAVFDQGGEIRPDRLGEEGLFHGGTRFLSHLTLELEHHRLFHLDSSVALLGQVMNVTLTNPPLVPEIGVPLALATLHVAVSSFLWAGALHQRVVVTNYGVSEVSAQLTWNFGADYADIFEVREPRRTARGVYLEPEVAPDRVTLGYHGRDDVRRRTVLTFDPAPERLSSSSARHDVRLAPHGRAVFDLTIACRCDDEGAPRLTFADAQTIANGDLQRRRKDQCRVKTSNEQMTSWIGRAIADVQMLTTETAFGPCPYAGLPWFNTPFGRDGIIPRWNVCGFNPGWRAAF